MPHWWMLPAALRARILDGHQLGTTSPEYLAAVAEALEFARQLAPEIAKGGDQHEQQ
jgi:hypothetical protein